MVMGKAPRVSKRTIAAALNPTATLRLGQPHCAHIQRILVLYVIILIIVVVIIVMHVERRQVSRLTRCAAIIVQANITGFPVIRAVHRGTA